MKCGNKYLEASFEMSHFKVKVKKHSHIHWGETLFLSVIVKVAEIIPKKSIW